jgi:hypothetical protein
MKRRIDSERTSKFPLHQEFSRVLSIHVVISTSPSLHSIIAEIFVAHTNITMSAQSQRARLQHLPPTQVFLPTHQPTRTPNISVQTTLRQAISIASIASFTAVHPFNKSADHASPHPTPKCAGATSSTTRPADTRRSTSPTHSLNAICRYKLALKWRATSHSTIRRAGKGYVGRALRSSCEIWRT